MDDKNIFALIFSELRQKGLITTLNDLSKKLPFDQSNLNKIKNGDKPIPNGLWLRLSKKFNVNPSFNGSNEIFLDGSAKQFLHNAQTDAFLQQYEQIRLSARVKSDSEMCRLIGHNVGTLYNAKSGSRDLPDHFIKDFCAYFKVPETTFYGQNTTNSIPINNFNKKNEVMLKGFSNVESQIKDIRITSLENQVQALSMLCELYEGILNKHNLLQEDEPGIKQLRQMSFSAKL